MTSVFILINQVLKQTELYSTDAMKDVIRTGLSYFERTKDVLWRGVVGRQYNVCVHIH